MAAAIRRVMSAGVAAGAPDEVEFAENSEFGEDGGDPFVHPLGLKN